MPRISTFCAALAVLALSANGASAKSFGPPRMIHVHPTKPHWIEVNSFQWGVGRGITSPAGGSAAREGTNSAIGEISVKGGNAHKMRCLHC